jgi:hypothetical protein
MPNVSSVTRRSMLLAAGATVLQCRAGSAADGPVVTVHRDPTCGCCSGWVRHLQDAGYATNVLETTDIDAVKRKLGVPRELAACHTAEVSGYVIEGHVPATALRRFLSEKPSAKGLAVRGMPVGSPGMEGGTPEPYDVVMFGPAGQRTYMRFLGEQPV